MIIERGQKFSPGLKISLLNEETIKKELRKFSVIVKQ